MQMLPPILPRIPRTPVILGIVGLWMSPSHLVASAVSLDLVHYPVNLGAAADPGSIPIGAVPAWTNNGYGRDALITSPLAVPSGGWEWQKGVVTNLNLSSEFGISLEYPDSTNVPNDGVTLHLKAWPVPGYSPYHKDQVIAATVLCLLLEHNASKDKPLVLKVVADDPKDGKTFSRFAGSYAMDGGSLDLSVGTLPDTKWSRDENGIFSITFPKIKTQTNAGSAPSPGVIPVIEGGGEDDERPALMIGWQDSPLEAMNSVWGALPRQIQTFSAKDRENVNPVHVSRLNSRHIEGSTDQGFSVRIWMPEKETESDRRDFMMACLAMAVTDAMNGGKGIGIECWFSRGTTPWGLSDDWKKDETRTTNPDLCFKQHLKMDLKTGTFAEGSLGGWSLKARPEGGWHVIPPVPKGEPPAN